MADSMMRIAGRGIDGTAKAIQTDDDGFARTKMAGMELAPHQLVIPQGKVQKLSIPTYDGSNQPIHPSVVYIPTKLSGYKYWMAFTPYPTLDNTKENPSIIASNDLYTWIVPNGVTNPIFAAPVSGFYADTTLTWDGIKLHLFWIHVDGALTKTYYSYSTNGITWAEKTEVGNAYLSIRGGMCYFNGMLRAYGPVATSEQDWVDVLSTTWSPTGTINFYPSRPAISNLRRVCANHGSVYCDGAIFHFLTSVSIYSGTSASLYYGFSLDGYRILYDPQPIMIPELDSWYAKTLYTSCIVPGENNLHYIFISGLDNDNTASIGVLPVKLNLGKMPFDSIKPNFSRTVFRAKEVRNTTAFNSGDCLPEFNECINKTILVSNTHNQELTLKLQQRTLDNIVDMYAGPSRTLQSVTIPAGSHVFLTSADMAALGVISPIGVRLALSYAIAPTTGNLTVVITGK